MASGVDSELLQFAKSVRDMKWSYMNRLGHNIASAISDMAGQGEEIDGLYIAGLLNDISEEILEEDAQIMASKKC